MYTRQPGVAEYWMDKVGLRIGLDDVKNLERDSSEILALANSLRKTPPQKKDE